MLRRIGTAAALLFLFAIAACDGGDAEQGRICRAVVPALERTGRLELIATAFDREAGEVRVDYRLYRGGSGADPGLERRVACRFGRGTLAESRRLVAVTGPAGPLGITHLALLNRFWIGDRQAFAEALERVGDPSTVAAPVDARLAYALQIAVIALAPAAIYALAALAFALVLAFSGEIHLAIGQTAMAGGYGALFTALALSALAPYPVVGLVVGALFGGIVTAGSLVGAVFGGVAIGFAESFWTAYVGNATRDLSVLVVLAGLLALRRSDPVRRR